ncbi:MAG TPA: hypothetical protein VGS57_21030 [Thermoanaerobaculia bacterium]|jgi:hypothetical protein|nr:hypothetical protein [Thermoanaerobaculia bacterium]
MRRQARDWSRLGLVSTVACATATLPLLAAAPAPTKLRFAWPETVKARVSYTSDRTRVMQNGGTSTTHTVTAYDLNVSRRGDQIVIARRLSETPREPKPPGVFKGPDGKPLPSLDPLQALIDGVAERIPVLVVDGGGNLVKVEGTDPIRAELEKILASAPLPRQQRQTVRAIFTDAGLAAIAKQQWSVWVGFWNGLALEPGRPLTQRRRGKFPGTEYVVDLVVEARLAGKVACDASDTARRCVELHMVSRPDTEDVARTIERLNLSATAGVRNLTMEQSFVVVAEPDTLLPHRCTRSLAVEIEHAPGSAGAPRSQKATETWTFDYAP